jgi:AhpD family alkylhydroperoxidase
MSLTEKERELVSIGASIASGCQLCTEVHVKDARKAGATEEEIARAASDAVATRNRANRVMERHTLKVLGQKLLGLRAEVEPGEGEETADEDGRTRIDELVSVAAAHAVNCEQILERHAARARALGVTDREITVVLRLSKFIKGKADSLCCKWI